MVTCVENMSCSPQSILEVFDVIYYQTGIPTVVFFAILVAIIIVAEYIRTKSLTYLAVSSIYATTVLSDMWIQDNFLEEQYHFALYLITLCIASGIVVMLLKLVKE